ncbi:coiled-coil domain-containing protein 40 [Culicoides brevitarsis]|uniref:coiled-coil domain-containing protein 40 n=1 Tax=Culicoides brevitarsis TaxID=469753 RepID=UPI00307B661F
MDSPSSSSAETCIQSPTDEFHDEIPVHDHDHEHQNYEDFDDAEPLDEQLDHSHHENAVLLLQPIHVYDESRPLTAEVEEIPQDEDFLDKIKDNPLFDRFQKTLKEHLLKVQAQLQAEIDDLDNQITESDRQREELGAELYDMQAKVDKQREQIHKATMEIQKTSEERKKREDNIVILKRDFRQKSENYKESTRIYNEMLMELDNLQALENEISKWHKEVKDEIKVSKRMVSKDAQDKKKLAEEKRKTDFFLMNLEQDIARREKELSNINVQIKEQDVIINDLKRSIADANADLEIIQNEQKRLHQSWNEVIVAITQRDKVLAKHKEELQKEHEAQKVLQSSIDATRKALRKEKETFVKLENQKNRIASDLMSMERDFERDDDEHQQTLQQIDAFKALLEQTEEDFKKARSEGLLIENHLKKINLQIERQNKQKFTLEEKVLECLQDQITSDKASDHRAKLLREAQAERRKLDIQMSELENKLANGLLDLEKWKTTIAQSKENMDRLQKEHDATDEVAAGIAKELDDMKKEIDQKMRKLDLMNKELDRLIQEAGGKEINPLEMKVLELEKDIEEMDKEITKSQKFWMQLQSNVVNLSQKRTNQLNEIIISRKQLLVIEQRALKIESEMARLDNENKDTLRTLDNLQFTFQQLNAQIYKTKKNHAEAEHRCQMAHQEITDRLEASEREILDLEDQIAHLHAEIDEMKHAVMEKHHEALSWETKFKMAQETKKYLDEELANTSETAMMKAEIHRMEVRYAQLKRAQDKLMQDLDNSVHQRGHIFDTASCREKVNKETKSRSAMHHKIGEMKAKIKALQAEITTVENGIVEVTGKKRCMETELETKKQELEDEIMQDKLLQAEIEQGMLLKQENLENIVRKQHRAKCYKKLLNTCQPYKKRSETAVNADYERQLEAHEHLTNIVEGLQQEFPEQKYVTTKILQTLKG